jgi:hypothetical protein
MADDQQKLMNNIREIINSDSLNSFEPNEKQKIVNAIHELMKSQDKENALKTTQSLIEFLKRPGVGHESTDSSSLNISGSKLFGKNGVEDKVTIQCNSKISTMTH